MTTNTLNEQVAKDAESKLQKVEESHKNAKTALDQAEKEVAEAEGKLRAKADAIVQADQRYAEARSAFIEYAGGHEELAAPLIKAVCS